MARRPKRQVTYWASKGGYGAWIGGRGVVLARGPDDAPGGPTYLAAMQEFVKLLHLETNKGTDDYLVSALFNQYRLHLAEKRESQVPVTFDSLARSFCEKYGAYRVGDLRPFHVEDWLKKMSDRWNGTSQHNAGRIVIGAVSWARKKGYIKTNPLAGCVDLPDQTMRGREARMPRELCDLLIAQAYTGIQKSREFGDLLWALRETGARPIELRSAEAHNYANGRLTYCWNTTVGYRHKTAKKTQRDRTIYLSGKLRQHVEELVKKYPIGILFRTPRGMKWTRTNLQNKWAWLITRQPVVSYCKEHHVDIETLKLYNFRHTWASDYLDATSDVFGCAQMLGTSVDMVQKRYGHPDTEKLHEKYSAFMAARNGWLT